MRHSQSRRFLQSTDGNTLAQVVEETMRRDRLLDLVLGNKGLIGDVKAGGSFHCMTIIAVGREGQVP